MQYKCHGSPLCGQPLRASSGRVARAYRTDRQAETFPPAGQPRCFGQRSRSARQVPVTALIRSPAVEKRSVMSTELTPPGAVLVRRFTSSLAVRTHPGWAFRATAVEGSGVALSAVIVLMPSTWRRATVRAGCVSILRAKSRATSCTGPRTRPCSALFQPGMQSATKPIYTGWTTVELQLKCQATD